MARCPAQSERSRNVNHCARRRAAWTGPAGDTRQAEVGVWGSKAHLEIYASLTRWGVCVLGGGARFLTPARPHRKLGRRGWGHTPHCSPPRGPSLIVASSESRSKLTFCTLHYASPRVPRGRGPAPAPRRLLDWAINLRAPRPPPPARPRAFVRLHAGRGRPPGRPVCSR